MNKRSDNEQKALKFTGKIRYETKENRNERKLTECFLGAKVMRVFDYSFGCQSYELFLV